MVSPTDLDIFSRSLGGDRRARTELYKKFLCGSSRISRLGAGYPDSKDFLHDCFNNLLRTGHSWDKETNLSQWVETVALWTLLQNERQRDLNARGARGEIRMCAEFEGEDVTRREVLGTYAPPITGPDDSPAARVLALLDGPDRTVFRKRTIENGTWEEAAEAAGKPLNTVGPIFARAANRLVRLFGAPPPMDDDLIPVFARGAVDPQKSEGRAISLQLDATFYAVTPGLQKIGSTTSYDARVLMLWDTAASASPPGEALRQHLDQCHYCKDLLRALLLMRQGLTSRPGAQFHLCPGSFTLSHSPDMVREAFDQHLAQCAICRGERTQVLDGQAPRLVRDEAQAEAEESSEGAGKKILWGLAAVILLGIVSFFGYRYVGSRNAAIPKADTSQSGEQLTVLIDPKYRDLVQNVPLDDGRIMASVLPENRSAVKYSIDQFSLGRVDQSLMVTAQLASKSKDPGVQMIYAMSLYYTRLMTDGYREMLKSEAMPPREGFRCWLTLQFALMVGDRKVIDREAEHLANDPRYSDKVRKMLDIVRKRG